MFERFSERARRAVFFARYKASEYGNPVIGTEHLLLGMLREDRGLLASLPGRFDAVDDIRTEIARGLTQSERIPTSVEMPLSAESKKALNFAIAAADSLAQRPVDIAHMLVGLLQVESSVAARILKARGLQPGPLLERIAQSPGGSQVYVKSASGGNLTLGSFLSGLQSLNAQVLLCFFAETAELTDSAGKRWIHPEIRKEFETLFAPYAKKNATFCIEETLADSRESFVATVLWKNALLASEQRAWMHRMTVALVPKEDDWEIVSIHVAVVQQP
jgi:ATP-dependent Clp protease ATP-binding subunit ClpC